MLVGSESADILIVIESRTALVGICCIGCISTLLTVFLFLAGVGATRP